MTTRNLTRAVNARIVQASDVAVGDLVANLGPVHAVGRVGAFVVFNVAANVASLADGKVRRTFVEHVLHEVDALVIVPAAHDLLDADEEADR